jgi:hypothetical protein
MSPICSSVNGGYEALAVARDEFACAGSQRGRARRRRIYIFLKPHLGWMYPRAQRLLASSRGAVDFFLNSIHDDLDGH